MTIYQSPTDLPPPVRNAVIDLIYRLADDDLVIGHRNSEWTGLAPILEADIAFSSIAQDQMGQSAAYYRLLYDLGEPDADANAFLREPSSFRCASLVALDKGDWADSTVRLYLYEAAKSLRIAALRESSYIPLARLAQKMRGEQKYHLMHARMWIDKLGAGTDQSKQNMQRALDKMYPHALGLFEPTEHDEAITAKGISASEGDLCKQWQADVDEALSATGLRVAPQATPVYGGRTGRHPAELAALLEAMQQVYRLDPTAAW